MNALKILKTEAEYNVAIDRTIELFDSVPGEQDFDELEILLLIVKDYEDKNYPITYPDAIDAIKLKLNEKGLKNKDLIKVIGSESHVSAILSRKRRITLDMARNLNALLGIPAEILLNAGALQ